MRLAAAPGGTNGLEEDPPPLRLAGELLWNLVDICRLVAAICTESLSKPPNGTKILSRRRYPGSTPSPTAEPYNLVVIEIT